MERMSKVALSIEFFYSPMCTYCPEARKSVMDVVEGLSDKIRVRVKEVNVLSPSGIEKAELYGIKSTPTIVINRRTKITGVPSKEQLYKAIQRELDKEGIKGS